MYAYGGQLGLHNQHLRRGPRALRENHVQGGVKSCPGRDIPQEGSMSEMFKEQQTGQCRGCEGKNSKSHSWKGMETTLSIFAFILHEI